MNLLWENSFGTKLDWMFGFGISMLWVDTMLELFHSRLQVEIVNNKFYILVIEFLLWKSQFIFFPQCFTGLMLSWI